MAPTLGYWKLRGLCEPIKLLLAHVGQEYQMKTYTIGPAPEYAETWSTDKLNLGLDFPNLPYYIDEDEGVKITQSLAIMRYLARKHDLMGKTNEETLKLDVLEQLAMDFIMAAVRVWYCPDKSSFPKMKTELATKTAPKLLQLVKFLGQNKFALGDRVTYVDFLLYSYLDYNRLFNPDIFNDENVSSINDYLARIESLPGVKKFMSSGDFSRFPITAPMAHFGGSSLNN